MYSPRLTKAFDLAAWAHANHRRKEIGSHTSNNSASATGKPYLGHLCLVAGLVLEAGGSEAQVCAALLHDVLEDHGDKVTFARLEADFGTEVAELVRALSDVEIHEPDGDMGPWWPRKRRFIAALATMPRAALLVVSADKIHNAQSVLDSYHMQGEALWQIFRGGRDGTLWYYQSVAVRLAEIYPENPLRGLLENRVTALLRTCGLPDPANIAA